MLSKFLGVLLTLGLALSAFGHDPVESASMVNPSQTTPAPQEDPALMPGANKFLWVTSPHFNARPEGVVVDTIVLHHTAGATTRSCVRWFQNPDSRVSAHYVIGKDGSIIQMVNTFFRAWHAGASRDTEGRENANNYSVGIEIVNVGNGTDPYPEAQVRAVRLLCGALARYRYRGQLKQIISHEYIAVPPGRKNDPINYPWESLFDLADDLSIRLIWGRPDKSPVIREPQAKG